MNERIEVMARVYIKQELTKRGMDKDTLRDMHNTEELIRIYDEKRRED